MASVAGTKRPAPDDSGEVRNAFDVEISEQTHTALKDAARVVLRAELANDRENHKRLAPAYAKRREVLKGIEKFWPVALMNCADVATFAQHPEDQKALLTLEDVWVERDAAESRAFTLEFHFKENPYFSDTVLRKAYKFMPPPAASNETPDEHGITDSMLDFAWERDIAPQAHKIGWKSDAVRLTRLYPRVASKEDPNEVAEAGSFFNLFESESDPFDIGMIIANELFPDAIDYFEGKHDADGDLSELEEDEEDEEDESDGDDAEEIDLEKPEPKKQKRA